MPQNCEYSHRVDKIFKSWYKERFCSTHANTRIWIHIKDWGREGEDAREVVDVWHVWHDCSSCLWLGLTTRRIFRAGGFPSPRIALSKQIFKDGFH